MKKKSKYKLVRKVLIIAILQDCICSLYAFLFYLLFSHAEYLFPDAEIFEDVLKYHVCSYFSGDVAEVENTFSNVLGNEVT